MKSVLALAMAVQGFWFYGQALMIAPEIMADNLSNYANKVDIVGQEII